MLDLATDMGLGLAAWASTGNQADLDLVEVSQELLEDPAVRVLMLYVEAADDGVAFAALARRARVMGKHLVVLRSGRSSAGRRAVASHTGSMLGDDVAFVLTAEEHGVVLVHDIDELLAVAAVLATGKRSEGRRVAVVTTSGGAGSLAADQCEDLGLEMPELSAATQDRLRPLIPAFGALANPVDVTAQLFNRGAHAFGDVCRMVADDPSVDVVAVFVTMVVGDAGARLAEDLVATAGKLPVPLLVGWIAGQELTTEGRAVFREAGIPIFGSVGDVARCAARMAPPRQPGPVPALPPAPAVPAGKIRELLQAPVVDGAALLRTIGIAQPASTLVTSPEAAREAVAALPGPGVLKLAAGDLAHKSDVGGVRVGVPAGEAAAVFRELIDSAKRHHVPDVEGVLVQELIPPGTELILGATGGRDGFPPVITVGLGGVTTELYRDIASGLAPVTPGAGLGDAAQPARVAAAGRVPRRRAGRRARRRRCGGAAVPGRGRRRRPAHRTRGQPAHRGSARSRRHRRRRPGQHDRACRSARRVSRPLHPTPERQDIPRGTDCSWTSRAASPSSPSTTPT